MKPEYNVSKQVGSVMYGRKHKPETIEKFKTIKRPSGNDNYMFGTQWSEETRIKILQKKIGSKRTEETKTKMSETAKKLNRYLDLLPFIESRKKKIIDNQGNQFNFSRCFCFLGYVCTSGV